MNFYIVRFYIRFILLLYVKKITVIGKIPKHGPVIYAGNHPNSFLDGMIIVCHNIRAVWSTARGDAFKSKRTAAFLDSCKIMPVFRGSEDRAKISKNYESFDKAEQIFKDNSQLVIFSEGISKYQQEILPLKKGTARMVGNMWAKNNDLKVVPTFLAYDSFTNFGKNIILKFDKAITKSDLEPFENNPVFYNNFNKILKRKLENLVTYDFPKATFFSNPVYYIGLLLNWPAYLIIRSIIKKKTKGTVFYDSTMVTGLAAGLLIYWAIIWTALALIF